MNNLHPVMQAALASFDAASDAMREQVAAAYAAGFRAARNAASKIVVDYTDGDSQFDGTIARMAEEIDRLMPVAPK